MTTINLANEVLGLILGSLLLLSLTWVVARDDLFDPDRVFQMSWRHWVDRVVVPLLFIGGVAVVTSLIILVIVGIESVSTGT